MAQELVCNEHGVEDKADAGQTRVYERTRMKQTHHEVTNQPKEPHPQG